ncbi:MAG: DEAD/DEAH box helicase [Sphingorhabdus sp.]
METVDELVAFIIDATQENVWGNLLRRGAAWSIIRRDGVLPPDAPAIGRTIETDLAEHGFALLRAALALRERGGESEFARRGFEYAAKAFEALVRNGAPRSTVRSFHRTIAAAAYHLAGFSAIAFSLFGDRAEEFNESPAETALIYLMLRDLARLRRHVRDRLTDDSLTDDGLWFALEQQHIDPEQAIVEMLNSTMCRALAYYDFALQTGEADLVAQAIALLDDGLALAVDAGVVPTWWLLRLCRSLIGDLWSHSLHVNVPTEPPPGGEEGYHELRELFLASLYARKNAEVELWPSQRDAARRSSNISDDLVVAMPTSAGKTRVAELATLMTLATGRRVLIVTPLRALSAQTERSFRRTFAPLGFSVSSLYGASGMSPGDEDALRTHDIIIATPEKLDFALRSDASIIDDVGLIVLDEGHLIGPTEREIRYEILVQRLLRRPDNVDRRIVCLSAILPGGDPLTDLTSWIRSDAPGDAVESSWRPTRQRFGTIVWQGKSAKLCFDLEDDGPWVARFVEEIAPIKPQRKARPVDNKELTLLAAWEFADQDKRVLVFQPQANSVISYGETVVELCRRGYLSSLLEDEGEISRALEIGREWLGDDHPAVGCLRLGVAIHHGRLPNPFLREIERLLAEGVLKVTVASPTLSQGLNLNAAVLLVPSLYRAGELISGEEFANVAGRAGRAFVDIEGLVLHVMFEPTDWRLNTWRGLVNSARHRDLKSGLIQVIDEIVRRLAGQGTFDRADAYEYLTNNRNAWTDVDAAQAGEGDDAEAAQEPLVQLVEKLDATVFGLVEALDADSSDLPRLLDEALEGSLWARQIDRGGEQARNNNRYILQTRARLIWNFTTEGQRRGHFAMGVGLDAGLALDAIAEELAALVDAADLASLQGDAITLGNALVGLAEHLLAIRPFTHDDDLPGNWRDVLRAWVSGGEVEAIGADNMKLVEDVFTYKLVWALEALRTRRVSLGWEPMLVAGGAAASLETGVPDFRMSLLVRAGLPSRRAAMAAVAEGNGDFLDGSAMREWLESDSILALTDAGNWPTPNTAALWRRFREETLSAAIQRWRRVAATREIAEPVPAGLYRVLRDRNTDAVWLVSPDYQRKARLKGNIRFTTPSVMAARVAAGSEIATIERLGRGVLL